MGHINCIYAKVDAGNSSIIKAPPRLERMLFIVFSRDRGISKVDDQLELAENEFCAGGSPSGANSISYCAK